MDEKVIPTVTPDSSFLHDVEEVSGQKISPCYQCIKCSSGCPVTFAMDYLPNRMVRMVQMGLKEEVLKSSTIWLCASCETCTTRCPNEVDIAHLMDTLRQMAIEEGIEPGEKNIPLFHEAFLSAIQRGGRVHELGMLARFKLKSGDLMKDAGLGWEMFKRGKLNILPSGVRRKKPIKRMFKAAKRARNDHAES